MSSVATTIEILADGDTLEAALEAAVEEAPKTLSNIRNVYVDDYRARVDEGEIQAYRVHTKIPFVVGASSIGLFSIEALSIIRGGHSFGQNAWTLPLSADSERFIS